MKNRIGSRFGRLVVIDCFHELHGKRNMLVAHCRCDCGQEKNVFWQALADGRTKSCGCLSRELIKQRNLMLATKHGGSRTRLYRIFQSMKGRCYRPQHIHYANYGGRGIGICDEWRDNFAAFREWAISHGYDDSKSIDRIDNDRGYSPHNCRWVDAMTQGNNRRTCHMLTLDGQTHTIAEWSRLTGIGKTTIRERLNRGWSAAMALEVKVGQVSSSH